MPSPFFGKLADNRRRGVMMTLSLVLTTIGTIIIGFWGKFFVMMLCGVVFLGLGVSLYHPPGLSWVTTAYEDPITHSLSSKYNQVLALHGIGGGLGASLGPISVYFLLGTLTWQELYLFWTIPLIIITIVFWIFVGRYEPENHRSVVKMASKLVNNGEKLTKNALWSSVTGRYDYFAS